MKQHFRIITKHNKTITLKYTFKYRKEFKYSTKFSFAHFGVKIDIQLQNVLINTSQVLIKQ